MEPDERLYIRVACSICRGMNRGCPYCDEQGRNYIEASNKRVAIWLKDQVEEDKMKFRKALEDV